MQTGWGCEQGARSVVSGIRSCVVRLRGGTEAGVRPRGREPRSRKEPFHVERRAEAREVPNLTDLLGGTFL